MYADQYSIKIYNVILKRKNSLFILTCANYYVGETHICELYIDNFRLRNSRVRLLNVAGNNNDRAYC